MKEQKRRIWCLNMTDTIQEIKQFQGKTAPKRTIDTREYNLNTRLKTIVRQIEDLLSKVIFAEEYDNSKT